MNRKILLACGIVASLLYIITTIIAALVWKDYSSASQTVSELFAIDAPTRPLVTPLFLAYSVLMVCFGIGVWQSAGKNRLLRVVGALLVAREVLGFIGTQWAPIHLRGEEGTLSDTFHAVITVIGVILYVFIMGFAAAVLGKKFRWFSIAVLALLVVFGTLAGLQGADLAANRPTPLMGIWERINIYATMIWIGVLAVALWPSPRK